MDSHAQVTREEVVQTLRRQSKGFQKTSSQYRGVTRHQKGKWEARIGQMVGKKYKWAHVLPQQVSQLEISRACLVTGTAGRAAAHMTGVAHLLACSQESMAQPHRPCSQCGRPGSRV